MAISTASESPRSALRSSATYCINVQLLSLKSFTINLSKFILTTLDFMRYFYNTRRTIFLGLGGLGQAAIAQTIGVNLPTAIATEMPVESSFGVAVQERVDPVDVNLPDAIATEVPVEPETQRVVQNRADSVDVIVPAAIASEVPIESEVESAGDESNPLTQITSVSQLSDVQPTDWAFQALQDLVERYGCIAGYPDSAYRGNRTLTRYEFAAGLNACLELINQRIAADTANFVSQDDLTTLQRLQAEFPTELATLQSRVDVVEARTAQLEANQFSTTTKLTGEVIFAVADTFGSAVGNPNEDDPTETILSQRTRLYLITSFTGKDILEIYTEAGNFTPFNDSVTGTNMTRLSFDSNTQNDFLVTGGFYQFPIGEKLKLQIDMSNVSVTDVLDAITPFTSSSRGALSRFGRFNPAVYRTSNLGSAVTLFYQMSDSVRLEAQYNADSNSNSPTEKNGLFNGAYSAVGQLIFTPSDTLKLSVIYKHAYMPGSEVNVTGSTGSRAGTRPFGNVATQDDSVGVQFNWKLSKTFTLAGWFGATFANEVGGNGDATLLNGSLQLAFPDLGGKGNVGGFLVGIPPKIVNSDNNQDPDTAFHIEAFYRYKVSDRITLNPGFFVIINPEHNSNNDSIFVGVVRSVFSF